jgi:hypothetical protein
MRRAHRPFAAAFMTMVLAMSACTGKPSEVIEPRLVGVIESAAADGDLLRMTMTDGSALTLDLNRDRPAYGGGLEEGYLLLIAEETEDGLRYVTISNAQSTEECPFVIEMGDAWEEPGAIVFSETAFRLQKAATFERPPWQDTERYSERPSFCLNAQAEVTGALSYIQLP